MRKFCRDFWRREHCNNSLFPLAVTVICISDSEKEIEKNESSNKEKVKNDSKDTSCCHSFFPSFYNYLCLHTIFFPPHTQSYFVFEMYYGKKKKFRPLFF